MALYSKRVHLLSRWALQWPSSGIARNIWKTLRRLDRSTSSLFLDSALLFSCWTWRCLLLTVENSSLRTERSQSGSWRRTSATCSVCLRAKSPCSWKSSCWTLRAEIAGRSSFLTCRFKELVLQLQGLWQLNRGRCQVACQSLLRWLLWQLPSVRTKLFWRVR